ncbi:hypothetical protein JTB14_011671 [Gonioctena quinquepunctata]|nr:hypothetical protein JTB14_011671 [Gonioctena quinquepunctata]
MYPHGYARPQYLFFNITAACIPPGYTNWQQCRTENRTDIHRYSTSSISDSAENETIENDTISARKSSSTIHITETIEDVIAHFRLDESSSEPEDTLPPIGDPIWGPVRGNNLKHFPFTEPNSGVKADIYERFYDKT